MKIKKLTTLTNKIEEMKTFYKSILKMEVVEDSSNGFSVKAGSTTLTFNKSDQETLYHFDDELIGFASYGYRKETNRYELISMMIGHRHQGKGYGIPILKAVIDEMVSTFNCEEIYLSVIHDNERAIRVYEKVGFKPTGEIEQGHHPEPIYCLKIS